ncbi:MAG TPA: hypothetical protein PKZ84_15340 [Anaerolineae bacterium]|nr:hypothetical protein [Anaerolineae bacterium]HQI86077.1 hypothetical protein [Anaerolineae bacterium]
MKLPTRILTFSTIIAAGTMAAGYGFNNQLLGALLFVALGLLWLVGQRYRQPSVAALSMLCFVVGAVLGAWYGVKSGWLLGGVTAALLAWDLSHFVAHVQDTQNIENARALERAHLQRLGIVGGLGLLLGVLALTVKLTLRFSVVIVLGLAAVFGLSRLIHYLRQESD